jgi:prepilin-type N-terminal cleavage/methylation domain-containing protein/prepilin-type processing-associated H-X9-DG protein
MGNVGLEKKSFWSCKMRKVNTMKGFTLIELLVVISIIALLLSILMPALSKVKEQAKFVVCGSNIKQVGLAGMMYTSENDGYFPIAWEWLNKVDATTGNAWCRWHNEEQNMSNRPDMVGTLWPYIENQNVVMCPTFKSISLADGKNHLGAPCPGSVPIMPQYAFSQNGFLGPTTSYPGAETYRWLDEALQRKVSHVTQPAKIFFFTEEGFIGLNDGVSPGYFAGLTDNQWSLTPLNDTALFPYWLSLGAIGSADSAGSFHKTNVNNLDKLPEGLANAVYADGHVEILYPWETGKKSTAKINIRELDHK